MIGVQKEFVAAVSVDDPVSALFEEIVYGAAFDYCTTIEFCRTIDAYRLGLVKRSEFVEPCFTNGSEQATLVYKRTEFGGMALSEIIKTMVSKYADQIKSGKFSKGNSAFGIWEPFTQADRSFIEKALK